MMVTLRLFLLGQVCAGAFLNAETQCYFMTPRKQIEFIIKKLNRQNHADCLMVSQLMDHHLKELRDAVLVHEAQSGPAHEVGSGAANEAQKLTRAHNKKMTRVVQALQQGTAVAHIAYYSKEDRWGHPEIVPVGFIFSHREVVPPLHEHIGQLKEVFPELSGVSSEELSRRVLAGEHGYVVPEYRNQRVGSQLMQAHEQDAQTSPAGLYTHRMASLWSPEAHLEPMLEKNGYKRLAVRESGAVIMAKKLKPAPSK